MEIEYSLRIEISKITLIFVTNDKYKLEQEIMHWVKKYGSYSPRFEIQASEKIEEEENG